MNENAESIHQKTERVLLGVVGLLVLVGAGFLFVYGAVTHTQLAATAASTSSAPNMAPPPVQKPSTASTPSKQDTLTPECEAKTKQNEKLAQYGVREEIRKQLPVEYNKNIQEATTQGFCKPELAVQQAWPGCDSKKCPLGVTVFPKGTKLSPGVVQCSSDKSGFVVACRQKDKEQGDGSVPPPERKPAQTAGDIGKDLQKTDASQQSGGQGGAPSGGGGGGSQSPANEAAQQAFKDESPPLPTQKSDALIAKDAELAQSLDQNQNKLDSIDKKLDAYYDNDGARGTAEETALLRERDSLSRTREELLADRAELAPYARSELANRIEDIGTPSTLDEFAQQQGYKQQASEIDRLMSDYGAQGAGGATKGVHSPQDIAQSNGLSGSGELKLGTAYGPGGGGIEGGIETSKPNPYLGGVYKPSTLFDNVAQDGNHRVTLATGDASKYGQEYYIGDIVAKDPYTGKNVVFKDVYGYVGDWCPACKANSGRHFDIAIKNWTSDLWRAKGSASSYLNTAIVSMNQNWIRIK